MADTTNRALVLHATNATMPAFNTAPLPPVVPNNLRPFVRVYYAFRHATMPTLGGESSWRACGSRLSGTQVRSVEVHLTVTYCGRGCLNQSRDARDSSTLQHTWFRRHNGRNAMSGRVHYNFAHAEQHLLYNSQSGRISTEQSELSCC